MAPASTSGSVVTPMSILGITDVWKALSLIGNKIGGLDLIVYRRSKNGGHEPATDHPAYHILKREPNEDMQPLVFQRLMQIQAMVWGNSYAYIFRDEMGDPTDLVPLDPNSTYPYREGGKLGYLTIINGENRKLLAENVLHIQANLSFDGMKGFDITYVLKEALGLSQAIQTYQSVYFANNGLPSVIIELPPDMSTPEKVEKFRQTWGNIHVGLANSHRPALMTNGAKVAAQLAKDNQAGQVSELTEQQVRAIAKIFGIPASYFGIADSYTSHNSLESQSKQFLSDTLEPHLRLWEQVCEKKLLRTNEFRSESVFIRFDRSKLIELDAKTREDINNQRLQNNEISYEEWRQANNLPVQRSGHYFRPANINLVDENFEVVTPEPVEPPAPAQEPAQKPNEPKPDEAQDERLAKLTTVTVTRLIDRVKKAVKSHAARGDLHTWDIEADHRYFWAENLGMFDSADQAIQAFFQEIKSEVNAISSQDVNKIRWEKYKTLVVKNLAGWGV